MEDSLRRGSDCEDLLLGVSPELSGADHFIGEKESSAASQILATAYLDGKILRKTIGSLRSVAMESRVQGAESVPDEGRRCLVRLDLSGHTVAARREPSYLRLDVLECQNLGGMTRGGKSDCCVVVFWRGKEVGRTPIVRDELNPTFETPEASFRLLLDPTALSSAPVATGEEALPENHRSGCDRWDAYAPGVRLEVWSMHRDMLTRRWRKDRLLGASIVRGSRGIVRVLEATEQARRAAMELPHDAGSTGVTVSTARGRAALELLPRPCSPHRRRSEFRSGLEASQRGFVFVAMSIENPSDDTDAWLDETAEPTAQRFPAVLELQEITGNIPRLPTCSSPVSSAERPLQDVPRRPLGVRCLDARGLPLGCDAYCRIFWNGCQVGQTETSSAAAANNDSESFLEHPPPHAWQRNPVWCTPMDTAIGFDAVVPLGEEAGDDELTIVLLDAVHGAGDFSRVWEHGASDRKSVV